MRYVQRPEIAPSILEKPFKKSKKHPAGTEFERAVAAFTGNGKGKKFDFKRYSEDEVKEALHALFHGKCAYCETHYAQNQPMDVEHYRPKGKVEGIDHGGYWWLAADWENLLPSCIDCNRRRKQSLPYIPSEILDELWDNDLVKDPHNMGKKDLFPLAQGSPRANFDHNIVKRKQDLEAEQRLLLDPTRDNPADHINFNIGPDDDWSLVLPWSKNGDDSETGRASIQIYGLNRLELVQARTRVLRDLEFLLEVYTNIKMVETDITARQDTTCTRLSAPNLSTERKKEIDDDLMFLASITTMLGSVRRDIIEKLKEKMDAKAPFSTLAQTWFEAHKRNL